MNKKPTVIIKRPGTSGATLATNSSVKNKVGNIISYSHTKAGGCRLLL